MKTMKAAADNAEQYTVAGKKMAARAAKIPKVTANEVVAFDQEIGGCSVQESVERERAYRAKAASAPKLSPKDYVRKYLGEVDEVIDELVVRKKKVTFNITKWFTDRHMDVEHVDYVRDIYSKDRDEIADAIKGEDKDLVEAYKFLNTRQKEIVLLFFNKLVEGCDEFLSMKRRRKALNRKVRVPKPVSVAKQIKNLKFKREDEDFNLVSINPEYIVGAQELWLFTTNNRMLTHYIAADKSGFKVKGSGLQNFDPKQSIAKRLRKPEEALKVVTDGGKVELRKLMDSLTTKPAPINGRINANVIILKVVK